MTSRRAIPRGYTLTELDWRSLTDDEIAEGLALSNALSAEIHPDDPPGTLADALRSWRSMPQRIDRPLLRVHDGAGRLVASGYCGFDPEHDDNPDLLGMGVNVHAEHRRRGLGTLLLRRLVELAADRNRARLVSISYDVVPGGAEFAAASGSQAKQTMHLNHLPTAQVDRALLQQWVDQGPARAPGYELMGWDGRCPDEHLEAYVDCVLVLNSAPHDDFELNDFTLTPGQFREEETRSLGLGVEPWVLAARRRSDGVMAGVHDVSWHASRPDRVNVGDTGVRPEDRGHALGKWLKAAMTLRVLVERPGVTSIRTGNADSNDAMLGINTAMGYRPLLGKTVWELDVAEAQAWLDTRR